MFRSLTCTTARLLARCASVGLRQHMPATPTRRASSRLTGACGRAHFAHTCAQSLVAPAALILTSRSPSAEPMLPALVLCQIRQERLLAKSSL